MAPSTKNHGDIAYRALAAIATIAPMLLVVAAGTLPEDLARAQLIVNGCGIILAAVATAALLRAAYALGFSKALKLTASTQTNGSVTA